MHRWRRPAQRYRQKLRLCRFASAVINVNGSIDNAELGFVQGYVQADIVLHGRTPLWPSGAAQLILRTIDLERDCPRLRPR